MEANQLNGSADRLAQAFRDVIGEAMQPVVQRLDKIETRLGTVETKVTDIGKQVYHNTQLLKDHGRRLERIEAHMNLIDA